MEVLVAWMPAIVAALALGGTVLVRFLPNRERREPSWNEYAAENRLLRADFAALKERFDVFEAKVDRRDAAFARVLRDASNAWPSDREGPYFDQRDIEEISDTFPPVWRHRYRAVR